MLYPTVSHSSSLSFSISLILSLSLLISHLSLPLPLSLYFPLSPPFSMPLTLLPSLLIANPILVHTLGIEDLVLPNKTLLVDWEISPNLRRNTTKNNMKTRIKPLVSWMIWKETIHICLIIWLACKWDNDYYNINQITLKGYSLYGEACPQWH